MIYFVEACVNCSAKEENETLDCHNSYFSPLIPDVVCFPVFLEGKINNLYFYHTTTQDMVKTT